MAKYKYFAEPCSQTANELLNEMCLVGKAERCNGFLYLIYNRETVEILEKIEKHSDSGIKFIIYRKYCENEKKQITYKEAKKIGRPKILKPKEKQDKKTLKKIKKASI